MHQVLKRLQNGTLKWTRIVIQINVLQSKENQSEYKNPDWEKFPDQGLTSPNLNGGPDFQAIIYSVIRVTSN